MSWTFYPVFSGTLISILAWTYFAYNEHLSHLPRTLSELASEKPEALRYYRTVLWVCGPQFAITTLFFIVPRIAHAAIITPVCILAIIAEMTVGIFRAQRGKLTLHDIIAGAMGFLMILSAFLFAWALSNQYRALELAFGIVLGSLGLMTVFDRKHYLFYELPFIYLAHISVLAAAVALK